MHSSIYQLSTTPILPENYLTETEAENYEDNFIDYVYELDEDRKKEAVENLIDIIPKDMFTFNEAEMSFTYKGGYEAFMTSHIENIKAATNALVLNKDTDMALWKIKEMIINPLNVSSLFYLNYMMSKSGDLIEDIKFLKPGDKIYVGQIFGFHW